MTLLALDVAHHMTPRRHVPIAGFAFDDVDDGIEEVGFAVLAAEVTADNVVMVGEVSFAFAAAVDALRV